MRSETGAGIMDCKRALEKSGGDPVRAAELLRQRGLDRAASRAGRAAKEGVIGVYLHHNGKIAALVELNCESDFVARTREFQEFARELALQVASLAPGWNSRESVPPSVLEGMKAEERERFFRERCLLEQSWIRDPSKTIDTLLKERASAFGENVTIGKFARLEVGRE